MAGEMKMDVAFTLLRVDDGAADGAVAAAPPAYASPAAPEVSFSFVVAL